MSSDGMETAYARVGKMAAVVLLATSLWLTSLASTVALLGVVQAPERIVGAIAPLGIVLVPALVTAFLGWSRLRSGPLDGRTRWLAIGVSPPWIAIALVDLIFETGPFGTEGKIIASTLVPLAIETTIADRRSTRGAAVARSSDQVGG